MDTIFSDGFESGDFSAWTTTGATGVNSVSVGEDFAAHGGCGLELYAAEVGYAYASFLPGASRADMWCRACAKVVSLTHGSNGFSPMGLAVFDVGYAIVGCVSVCSDGGVNRLGVISTWDSGVWSNWMPAGSPEIELGRWYAIELYVRVASAPGANDGVVRVYLDGELIGEKSDIDNDYRTCADLRAYVNRGGAGGSLRIQVDDFAFGAERIGPPRGYRIYSNNGAGPVEYDTPAATRSEYVTSWTSSALSYPAAWRFGVRAFNENGEERNLDAAEGLVLLATGEESPERPHRPVNVLAEAAEGGKVRVRFSYDAAGEAAECTHFHVYADTNSGEEPFGSPLGSMARDDGPYTHYAFLSGALTHGETYRVAVRAATAVDVEDDGGAFVTVTVDAQAPEAPASLSASVAR